MEQKSTPSGRELFPIFLAKILTQLIDDFPCQSRIDLQNFVRPDVMNFSAFSTLSDSLKGTPFWEEEARKDDEYKSEVALQKHELAVARGTLLFLISAGYINAPEESIENLKWGHAYYLNDCSLSEKGYAKLFRKPDDDIELLIENVTGQTATDGQTGELVSCPKRRFLYIPDVLSTLAKEAGKALPEQAVSKGMEQLFAGIFGG